MVGSLHASVATALAPDGSEQGATPTGWASGKEWLAVTSAQAPPHDSGMGLADLFFAAEPAERRMLLMSLGSVESEKPQAVQPVETNRALEAAALGRDRAGFTKLLQNALGLSHEQAEKMANLLAGSRRNAGGNRRTGTARIL